MSRLVNHTEAVAFLKGQKGSGWVLLANRFGHIAFFARPTPSRMRVTCAQ